MRIILRHAPFGVSRSPGSWLTLMLLCVVIVPTLGVVWFMRQAVDNERLAGRQKLAEAYHAHLIGLRARLEENWSRRDTALPQVQTTADASSRFAQLVTSGAADAVVFLDPAGSPLYPDAPAPPESAAASPAWRDAAQLEVRAPAAAAVAYARLATDAADADTRARAMQAQARCLLRAGDRPTALATLTSLLDDERLAHARDPHGRLVAPNAGLLALELARELEPARVSTLVARLRSTALDYDHARLPAPQRRFLLRELQRLEPDETVARLLAAEDLAAAFVASDEQPPRDAVLRPSALPDVWQWATGDGHAVVLHRTPSVPGRLGTALGPSGLPDDVRLDVVAPGRDTENALVSLPAGPLFPGWRLALVVPDPKRFDAAVSARAVSYAWIAALVVLSIIVIASLAWGLVRRQAALTRLRNDLVANVTHELKTPLASMRLLVDTLLQAPELDARTTRDYLQLIATENLRLSRLIGNFLTFSRIERNKYTFDFHDVPATEIVAAAAAAVRDKMQAPGCRFEVDAPADLPRVSADADALSTALINLLDNAWKYSGADKVITLTARVLDGTVRFAVRDNGIGLSPRDSRRIFRRFVQVHRASPSGGGGVGLGLSIVEFIVSAHRGTVQVESTPGQGSTFTIALPAAPTP